VGGAVWTPPAHALATTFTHWTSVMQATQFPAPSQSLPPPSVHGVLIAAGMKPHVSPSQVGMLQSPGGSGQSPGVVHVIPPELLDADDVDDVDDADDVDDVDDVVAVVDVVEPSPPEPSVSVCGVGPGQAAMVIAKPPNSATASPVWT
jgi:hypothetical protein